MASLFLRALPIQHAADKENGTTEQKEQSTEELKLKNKNVAMRITDIIGGEGGERYVRSA